MQLRPQSLKDYVGQETLKPLIQGAIDKCNETGKTFGHTLCFGPSGVGKTTLARCICNALKGYTWVSLTASKELTGPMLRKLLLDLDVRGYGKGGKWQSGAKKFFVFIDEVSELKLPVWESVLYNAMEDCEVGDERGNKYWLPEWSGFFATTAPYVLPPPALGRMSLKLALRPYSVADLVTMIRRLYPKMPPNIAEEVARRSRGIARLALNFAEGVNDHGLHFFEVAGVNEQGLNELDLAYLAALESSNGKPMSLNSISNIVRESAKTLAAFVEPELFRLGLIAVGPHGRSLVSVERGPKVR